MKKYALLASAASLFAASSAVAADLPSRKVAPVAPVVPAFTWTGFYAGVNAGVNWSSRNVTPSIYHLSPDVTADQLAPAVPVPFKNDRTGFIGGIQVGYNYQVNQFVFGIEADAMGAAINKTGASTASFTYDSTEINGPATNIISTKVQQNWLGTLRARAGFSVDRFLVYATGGLALGSAKLTSTSTVSVPTADWVERYSGSGTVTKGGYAVGGGIEYAITNNWIVRGEYLYYNLGSVSQTVYPTTATGAGETFANQTGLRGKTKTTIDGNIIRAAVSYKF